MRLVLSSNRFNKGELINNCANIHILISSDNNASIKTIKYLENSIVEFFSLE
jgi:hypothetical protein